MATFALVHGAFHGAWCWERLAPLLQQAGHVVVLVDWPVDDNSASFDACADVMCAALGSIGDDLILVGHSYGGHIIPLVAARRPVRHLVYLCAYVAEIGKSMMDQLRDEPEQLNPALYEAVQLDDQSRVVVADAATAQALFYADCDEQTAQSAFKRLRPQSGFVGSLPCSLAEFPTVSSTCIICSNDQVVGGEWSKRVARDRLRAELIELPGSHSPFFSRPQALADVLVRIAEQQSARPNG